MSSLDNGLRILGLLSKQRPVLRVGEVCRALDIPKSSASRLLRAMAEHGILAPAGQDGGYVVGPRTFELAGFYISSTTLFDMLDAAIERLCGLFGFVGYVCRLEGADALILRRRYGSYPLRMVRDVGERVPAFQTSVGRALLALEAEERARAAVARDPGWAGRVPEALEELRRVRRLGIVTSLSTHTPGVMATAAALRDADSGEALAFSVSFPAPAADAPMRARIAAEVRAEAIRIGRLVGDRAWIARGDAADRRETTAPATRNSGGHHVESA